MEIEEWEVRKRRDEFDYCVILSLYSVDKDGKCATCGHRREQRQCVKKIEMSVIQWEQLKKGIKNGKIIVI